MKLGTRRPGTSTTFIDATSGEDILQVASDEGGLVFMAFRLYDATGRFVAESEGLQRHFAAVCIRCSDGELLLDIPSDPDACMQYRLYNRNGVLLTMSDGIRTKIYPLLRMEGVGRNWVLPARDIAV
jgi:hypothetical protein